MLIKLSSIVCLIIFSLLIQNCEDSSTEPEITEKPIVVKTSNDYSQEIFRNSYPKMETLSNIGKAYKNNYSEEIKSQLIDYMMEQVRKMDENIGIFNECINITGCNDMNSVTLPTYAEKAKYNGEDVWIIQNVWGIDPSDLLHYKCFVIATQSLDTLDFIRCK